MSRPVEPTPEGQEPVVIKVNDKRRVADDGAPRPQAAKPPAEPASSSGPRAAEVERLTLELEAARRRVNELAQAYQAGERDREEFKQRLTRERERLLDVEKGNVAVALLEAVDELELCLASATDVPMGKGVKLIRDGLLRKVEALGVERVELFLTQFDPALAEAAAMELTGAETEHGRVVKVLEPCYRLNGRVIRPGRVTVARYVKPAEA